MRIGVRIKSPVNFCKIRIGLLFFVSVEGDRNQDGKESQDRRCRMEDSNGLEYAEGIVRLYIVIWVHDARSTSVGK